MGTLRLCLGTMLCGSRYETNSWYIHTSGRVHFCHRPKRHDSPCQNPRPQRQGCNKRHKRVKKHLEGCCFDGPNRISIHHTPVASFRSDQEVAQTITLDDTSDDLVEELAYSGVTDEDIISFVTSFSPVMHISGIVAKLKISSGSKSIIVDLHISGATRDLDAEQDLTPVVVDEQTDLSSERDPDPPVHEEVEHQIEMHAIEEGNFENGPEFRSVDAVSPSRRYRIQICNPPPRSPFYKIRGIRHSALKERVRRSRRLYHSRNISGFPWSRVLMSPFLVFIAIRGFEPLTEREFRPKDTTTLYYPSCSRFLRTSSPNHHTISHIEVALDSPQPTPPSEDHPEAFRSKPNSHTRWGVLLEVVVGVFLVGFFFCVIAVLTHFKPSQSSLTERGVMMAWLASGLYGFCLPFRSTPEPLRVFFLFPLVSVIDLGLTLKRKLMDIFHIYDLDEGIPSGVEAIMSFAPLAIFVPPIWGFVLVGRMLVEWGNCTRLY